MRPPILAAVGCRLLSAAQKATLLATAGWCAHRGASLRSRDYASADRLWVDAFGRIAPERVSVVGALEALSSPRYAELAAAEREFGDLLPRVGAPPAVLPQFAERAAARAAWSALALPGGATSPTQLALLQSAAVLFAPGGRPVEAVLGFVRADAPDEGAAAPVFRLARALGIPAFNLARPSHSALAGEWLRGRFSPSFRGAPPRYAGTRRDAAELLEELHARGADQVSEVSLLPAEHGAILRGPSRSGVLRLAQCFREAPQDVLTALALHLVAGEPDDPGVRATRRRAGRIIADFYFPTAPASYPPCVGTPAQQAYLCRLYAKLNETRFGGRLPTDPLLRFSSRMARRLGHCDCTRGPDRSRTVGEIALNVDLLLEENDDQRTDTMVHEMCHGAAWLFDAHREHGEPWRSWAARAGCEPRACTAAPVARRGGSSAPTRVPGDA